MVKYLQMDGVDDYLRVNISNLKVDKVVMDVAIYTPTSAYGTLFDINFQWFRPQTNGTETFASYWNTVLVGGSPAVSGTDFMPNGVRKIIDASTTTEAASNDTWFFRRWGGGNFLKADVYDIKLYLDGVLLAHYDMSTGTVNDQSGNGRHATLTGGTWLDDGTGGSTGTVHEGESVLSSVSNLIAESNLIMNGESTLSSQSDLLADGGLIFNGESTFSATSNLTAEATVIQSTEAILSAISNLTAEGDKISQEVSVDLSAISNLSAIGSVIVNGDTLLSANSDLTAIGDIVSMDISVDLLARATLTVEGSVIHSSEASFSTVSQLEALANLVVSGEVELSATSQLTVFPEKNVIGTIYLKGSRQLYVYLLGSRDLIVNLQGNRESTINLKGGVNVTVYNQNFVMESGDSKILNYVIGEELTGATLSWEMYRRGESTPFVTKVGNSTGNSVQVTLVPEDTAALKGTYAYELKSVDQQGYKSTLAKGVVTLE